MSDPYAAVWVDFRGHRYTPPWRCLCCGVEVSVEQFCYGRACGRCDTGACQTGLTTHEPGHGRHDVILSAPVIDGKDWCAAEGCLPHLPNAPALWRSLHPGTVTRR